MNELSMGGGDIGGESLDSGELREDFDVAMSEYKNVSFEDFRSKMEVENSDQNQSTELDLTPLEEPVNGEFFSEPNESFSLDGSPDDFSSKADLTSLDSGEEQLSYANFEDDEKGSENQLADFDLTPLEPIDGEAFVKTNGNAVYDTKVPLASPMNGALLEPTGTEGIMMNNHDEFLYKITPDGDTVPLKSPINGAALELTRTDGIMRSKNDDLSYKVTPGGMIIPLKSPVNGEDLKVVEENVFEDETTGQLFYLDDNLEFKLIDR